MRIAMASDHSGRALKEEIKALLRADGHEISDFGTDTDDAADLPDYVYPAALAVARGGVDRGIFVDGVGYGSAMIANKITGIYAAVCQDPFCAELARSHSDTNVLCLGGKIIGSAIALEIVRVWMATEWLGEGEGGREVRPTGQQGEGHRRAAPRALGLRTQATLTISQGSDSTCRRHKSERGGTWSDLCWLQRRKAATCSAFPQTDPLTAMGPSLSRIMLVEHGSRRKPFPDRNCSPAMRPFQNDATPPSDSTATSGGIYASTESHPPRTLGARTIGLLLDRLGSPNARERRLRTIAPYREAARRQRRRGQIVVRVFPCLQVGCRNRSKISGGDSAHLPTGFRWPVLHKPKPS